MDFPEENMIDKWLEENHNPEIEIQVLNEVVDKLVEERDTLLKQRDEFAIEFAEWIAINDYRFYSNGWSKVFKKGNITSKEILEIYKKEKGL
jgi:hypothetical protein